MGYILESYNNLPLRNSQKRICLDTPNLARGNKRNLAATRERGQLKFSKMISNSQNIEDFVHKVWNSLVVVEWPVKQHEIIWPPQTK